MKGFYRSSSDVGNGGGAWTTFVILLTKITQKSIEESTLWTTQLKSNEPCVLPTWTMLRLRNVRNPFFGWRRAPTEAVANSILSSWHLRASVELFGAKWTGLDLDGWPARRAKSLEAWSPADQSMIRLDSGEPLETAMRDGQLASSKIVPDDVSRCDYENAGPGGRMDARRRDAHARLV